MVAYVTPPLDHQRRLPPLDGTESVPERGYKSMRTDTFFNSHKRCELFLDTVGGRQ